MRLLLCLLALTFCTDPVFCAGGKPAKHTSKAKPHVSSRRGRSDSEEEEKIEAAEHLDKDKAQRVGDLVRERIGLEFHNSKDIKTLSSLAPVKQVNRKGSHITFQVGTKLKYTYVDPHKGTYIHKKKDTAKERKKHHALLENVLPSDLRGRKETVLTQALRNQGFRENHKAIIQHLYPGFLPHKPS